MRRALPALLLALAAPVAPAENVAGWAHGGIGMALREPADASGPGLQYDTGTLLHVDVGNRYPEGLMVRVDYAYTLYDELTAAGGALTIEEDIERHEARGGLFYAPWTRGPLGWRIGGGYAYVREDVDAPEAERQQDGGYVEAGLVVRAGQRVTLDFAGAGLKLEGKDDYDAEGAELRAGATLHTRPLDLGVALRYQKLERDAPFDEELLELRFGVGGAWGYPESR
jgi:hypothetical protein